MLENLFSVMVTSGTRALTRLTFRALMICELVANVAGFHVKECSYHNMEENSPRDGVASHVE